MSSPFAIYLPPEQAFRRKVLFAAEIVDAVTLEPVTQGLEVQATGLKRKPIVNCGGFFVWLEEGNLQPQQVVIDASKTFYESIAVPAPLAPDKSVRIELAPRSDYPFASGACALRASLVESSSGTRTPVVGAEIRLQWIDDHAAGTVWVDAPTHSHSGTNGDFAAPLRLTPKQVPRLDAGGGMRAQLRASRQGITRTSAEFSLPVGRITDSPPFAWNDLTP
ncbi:MAG: hypothetical protein QOJ84_370 [Bradyrhizobium sp.]|jgi:hypothetical protein|nr:hypothetical protein [Bradyrhizobium sp.]